MNWKTNPDIALGKLKSFSAPPISVEVGVLDNAQDYDEKNSTPLYGYSSKVVFVAHHHETAPESNYNKWLLKALQHNEKKQTLAMKRLLKKAGDDPQKRKIAMEKFGFDIAEEVQQTILHRKISLPDNAVRTLNSKQGSVPMVDTKHLISVIDSQVVKGG